MALACFASGFGSFHPGCHFLAESPVLSHEGLALPRSRRASSVQDVMPNVIAGSSVAAGFSTLVFFLHRGWTQRSRTGRDAARRGRTSRVVACATLDADKFPRSSVPCVATADKVMKHVEWPDSWPYTEKDFARHDEEDDALFYAEPRLCAHIDPASQEALRAYYAKAFAAYPQARILDLCSSCVSHYPQEQCWSHVSILGMNEIELKSNKQADDYRVRDLNKDPTLPYDDESFDVVTCAVSFDYLTQPLRVMQEVARVLQPGGVIILSTSNKCFPSKAIDIWVRATMMEKLLIYGSYVHFADEFEPVQAHDLSSIKARGMGIGDPVYVVQGRKRGGPPIPVALTDGQNEEELGPIEHAEGLYDWLESRELSKHFDAVNEWCLDVGAVDFLEVAENTDDLAEFLGDRLTRAERTRLQRGTR